MSDHPLPVVDCEHATAVGAPCLHPSNITPECHVHACPLLGADVRLMVREAIKALGGCPCSVCREVEVNHG